MRLLLVVPTLSSYEAFLSDFAQAAVSVGHEVHVATQLKLLDGRAVEGISGQGAGIFFHSILMPRGASPVAAVQAARELRRLVAKVPPDWIQAHFSAAALVCALAKSKDWPFTSCVIQGLACTLARGKSRLAAWCGERLAMARLDEMWVLTDDDFDVIRDCKKPLGLAVELIDSIVSTTVPSGEVSVGLNSRFKQMNVF